MAEYCDHVGCYAYKPCALHCPFPGRLGCPSMTLETDPRTDGRLIPLLKAFGLHAHPPPLTIKHTDPLDKLLEWGKATEAAFGQLFGALFSDLPALEVERRSEVISGVDDNKITLYITTPRHHSGGALPCIYYCHGGGMAFGNAADPNYVRVFDELASRGLLVVGVQFRNCAGSANPPAAFPAGLNDCFSGLKWTHENRDKLNISKIIVCGESGGGNLSLALTLKAKRENANVISGTYALCPYISNLYEGQPESRAFNSLYECDGYWLDRSTAACLAPLYTPRGGGDERNPLAWPFWTPDEDLKAFPPTVIHVNELDPLRDEGLAFNQRLRKNGVRGHGVVITGTPHAGEFLFPKQHPDMGAATYDRIASFARSV